MKKRGGGSIVHTGSMWALQAIGATPSAAYSAANAGVHSLVHNLALELAADKIRINAVAPAVVETPIYSTFLSKEEVPKVLPTFNAFHPLGRIGQTGYVAEAILFLPPNRADGSPARFYQSTVASWRVGTKAPSGMARESFLPLSRSSLVARPLLPGRAEMPRRSIRSVGLS
jgi:NAD(P)-dependent dehydrogenase (short-subunit alcohol dehydrogenase family)